MSNYLLRLMALLLCTGLALCGCNKDDDEDDEDDVDETEAFTGYTLSDDEEKIPAEED